MRKYIHMAKEVKPQLSEEASAYISERYAELRSADMGRSDLERVSQFKAFRISNLGFLGKLKVF